MFMSLERYTGQNHNIKIAYKSSEKCGKVKIFGKNTNKSKSHALRN
jgi:hypothetical protein